MQLRKLHEALEALEAQAPSADVELVFWHNGVKQEKQTGPEIEPSEHRALRGKALVLALVIKRQLPACTSKELPYAVELLERAMKLARAVQPPPEIMIIHYHGQDVEL